MKPAEALQMAAYGVDRPIRDLTVPELLRAVEGGSGGSRSASREVGVSIRTWQRWRAGTQKPRPVSLSQLIGAARRGTRRQAAIRALWNGDVTLTGWMAASSDLRHRTIRPGPDITSSPEGELLFERAANELVADRPDQAMDLIAQAVYQYYAPITILNLCPCTPPDDCEPLGVRLG